MRIAPTHPNKSLNSHRREGRAVIALWWKRPEKPSLQSSKRLLNLSNENCDRAMKLAHKLSMQLRAAEDRINQLEAEVELFRDRTVRAERWLQTIQKEIEEKLIAPRSANATEQTSPHKDAEL